MRLVVLLLLVACAGSIDGNQALYRAGRMHEVRDKLRGRDLGDARAAILYARNEIDLRVIWDDGSLGDAAFAVASAKTEDPKLAAELVQAAGEVMFWAKLVDGKGEWPALAAQFDRAIAMREAAGDRRGVAESTFYRGLIAQFIETMEKAKGYWERARELGKGTGDPLLRSYPIRHLGDLAEAEGDLVLAERLHRESLALREQDGDVIRLFNARLTLAKFYCERMRRCDAATPQIEAARQTVDALRMPHGKVEVAMLEAALAEWRGDLAARDAAWAKALVTANSDEIAAVMLMRAGARLRAGDLAKAIEDADRVPTRDGLALKAIALQRKGDAADARAMLALAWKDPEKPTARMLIARNEPGDLDAALAAAQRDHDVRTEIDVLVARGDLEAANQRAQQAHLPAPVTGQPSPK